MKKEGLIKLNKLLIDGTKIEVNANRYTFVWRGSLNYHFIGLLDIINTIYTKYNTLLHENKHGPKYDIGDAQMLIVEGEEKHKRLKQKEMAVWMLLVRR